MDELEIEEAFLSKDKKEHRKDRKLAQKLDRSKFKEKQTETDFDCPDDQQVGRVLSVLPENKLLVKCFDDDILCTYKGSMRYEKKKDRNIIVIGDYVHVKPPGLVTHVKKRRSTLYRTEAKKTKKRQLIAANIDLVFITMSVTHPKLKPHLIDRYIIVCKEGNLTPVLILNKIDLLDTESKPLYKEVKQLYTSLGIEVIAMSATSGKGMRSLKKVMKNKTSVFSGQSGVGKTSIINALTGSTYKTKDVIAQSNKGAHTTTQSITIDLGNDSYCIDTPGIKSFGTGKIDRDRIDSYFEEISNLAPNCKFTGCTHTHEPSCAVKEALEEGKISKLRYSSYCNMLAEKDDR